MTVPDQDLLPADAAPEISDGLQDHPLPVAVFLAVIAGSTAVLGYLARNVFLFWDDYLFLGQASAGSWSRAHLAEGLFQHFSPVTRAVNLAVVPVLPGRSWVILAVLMACAASLVAATTVLMVALFGRTWVAVVGAVLLGPTLSLLQLVNWWTAGVNIMPSLAGTALCLAGVAFLVRGRSRWWGVIAALAYLVAVLDWESAMLTAGYALAWLVLFRSRVTPESLWAVLRRTWWMWALLVVIGGASLLNYQVNYYLPPPPAPLGDVINGLGISLFDTLVPSLLGFHDPSTHWFSVLGTVVGTLTLVCLVVFTLISRVSAWRGWLFALAGWFLPSVALLLNRVGYFGPQVAENVFYYYLPSLLFVVGVMEAWVAPRRAPAKTFGPPARVRRVVGVVAVAVVVLAYIRSADATIAQRIPYGADPNYVPNATTSAAAIDGTTPSWSVINGDVTEGLVPAAYAPFNRVSNVLGLNIPGLVVDAAQGPYYVASLAGELRPVQISWVVEQESRLIGDSPLNVTGVTNLHFDQDRGVCFSTVDDASRVVLTLQEPVSGDRLVVRTLAGVDQPTGARLQTSAMPDGQLVGANDDGNRWEPGQPGRLDTVRATTVWQLVFDDFTPGSAICLSSLSVGTVVPR